MFDNISTIIDTKCYNILLYDTCMLKGRKNMITFCILGFSLISAAILIVFF